MKTILSLAAVLLLSAPVAAEVTVTPVALTVGSPAIEDMDFSFRPNGVNAGTSVHLLVAGLDNPIVKLDDDNSTLDKAVDSTGKDLLQEPPKQDNGFSFSSSSGPIGPFPRISEDGTQLIVELTTPQAPAPGATGISYQGSLAITIAAGKTTASAQGVATKPGKVQLGDHTIEITGIGPSDWEEGKFNLKLKMNTQLLDAISAWKITAPDGTELSDGPNSTMTMNQTAQLELTLEQNPGTINIDLELYDGLETIQVPVVTEVGLGIE